MQLLTSVKITLTKCLQKMKFKNEIDRLRAAHYFIKYGNTEQQLKAEKILANVHRQYGTTDIVSIQSMIH